jgi:hypothetical protein
MSLVDALQAYLESHKRTLRGRTPKFYEQAIKMLSRFFGGMMTKEIHAGHLTPRSTAIRSNVRKSLCGDPSAAQLRILALRSCFTISCRLVLAG